MRRSVSLTSSLAIAAAAAVVLAQSAAAFAPAGSAPLLTRGSADQGAVSQARSITLTLAPRDAAALRSFDAQASHPLLTPAQFAMRFAPSQATLGAVEAWASAHGLGVTSVSPDRLLVRLSGSTTALGSALGVSFDRFRAADGSSYVSSTGTATLPASLASAVSAISGLSDLSRAQLDTVHRSGAATPGLSFPASYGPQQLGSLYDASVSPTGAGQTVSVIAEGDLSQPKPTSRSSRASSACRR